MRVLIVDDHRLIRAGIRRLLADMNGIDVIGEAADAATALDLVSLKHPDVVLLDLSMPVRSGLDLLPELRVVAPQTQVLILSMYEDATHVRTALERGAIGYVVKGASPAELELALNAAAIGQTFLSPQVSGRMLQTVMRGPQSNAVDQLSRRQRQILHALGRGQGNKEIAQDLGISAKTVENHRARLMEALGCRRATELIRLAVQIDSGLDQS